MMANNEHVFYPKQRYCLLLGLLSLLFTIGGVLLLLLFLTSGVWMLGVLSLLTIFFFGWCSKTLWQRVVHKKPSIIINEKSMVDHANYYSAQQIKWNEIKEIYFFEYFGQRLIGIELHNAERIRSKLPFLNRFFFKLNRLFTSAEIGIPQSAVSIPLEELYTLMMEKYNRYAMTYIDVQFTIVSDI